MNLITGGSGFCGSYIVKRLLSDGEKVRIFDLINFSDPHPNLEFFKGDIRDQEAIKRACQGIERIFHTVALVPLSKAGQRFWDVNVSGTENLLSVAFEMGIKKVVHLSSSAIFGTPKMPIKENAPYDPIGPYGRAKMDGELRCHEYIKRGLNISIIRPRTMMAPGRLGIFQILFDWIRRGKKIYIIGNGSNRFQFLHAEDLAEACVLAGNKEGSDTYNIGADEYSTLREDLEALIKHAGTKSKVAGLPVTPTIAILKILDKIRLSPLAPWHYLTYHKDFYFNNIKPKDELGWRPKWGNVDMFIASYEWYLKHHKEVDKMMGKSHRFSPRHGLLKILRLIS